MATLDKLARFLRSGAREAANLLLDIPRTFVWTKAVDAAASTATAETPIYMAAEDETIDAIYIVPAAALTADETNNATLTLKKRPASAYGTPATMAAMTTNAAGSGNWVAFTPESFGTLSNATFAAGDLVTLTIAKGGSGVAIPISAVVIQTRKI